MLVRGITFKKSEKSDSTLSDDDSIANEKQDEEQKIKKAAAIDERYYWIGKDYANTFKVDFCKCDDFSTG